MDIKKYISSGIIERYVTGMAGKHEALEFEYLLRQYPELSRAIQRFNQEVDEHVQSHEGPPPPGCWALIESQIKKTISS